MNTLIDPNLDDGGATRIDVLQFFRDYRRVILRIAAGAAVVVAVLGALYLVWGQPVRTTASVLFRPTFLGADVGRYPNKLPFGPGDITDAAIVDQVFDKNGIQDYCARDVFRGGFFVEQRSTALSFLDADYQTRLADVRITPIDRTRLQAEYQAKRDALPLAFALVFIEPSTCRSIPTAVMTKTLSDVLSTWAEEGQSKRGVLRLNVDVLTPNIFEIGTSEDISLLIRADLVRSGLRRLAANIKQVEELPGAQLIRLGEQRATLLEVRQKVDDLVTSGLEPLVISAGRGLGSDSLVWVDEALSSASREQDLAEGRAKAFLDALREYSGAPNSATGARIDSRPTPTGSSDVQTLAPQIDRTFIDRIVELSAPNMAFRQEMTRLMVDASVEAVRQQGNVAHYRHLSEALRKPAASSMTPQQVAQRLTAIVDSGKALAKQFNDLYEELSRVSLRSGAAMYQVTGAASVDVVRGFTLRDYFLSVTGAFFVTLLLSLVGCLAWSRLRSASLLAK